MNLFQAGWFTLHSGKASRFKIECDALTDDDWLTLAMMICEHVPAASGVVGVPTGGDKLAFALTSVMRHDRKAPILVVDDVWTTGTSMHTEIGKCSLVPGSYIGWVVFARGPLDPWCRALFEGSV